MSASLRLELHGGVREEALKLLPGVERSAKRAAWVEEASSDGPIQAGRANPELVCCFESREGESLSLCVGVCGAAIIRSHARQHRRAAETEV